MIDWIKVRTFLSPFLKTVVILLVGYFVIRFAKWLLSRALKKTKLDPSLVKYSIKAITILLDVFVVLAALDSLGVSTSSVVAALSAGALAVGIALKDSLSNVAGGLWLLFSPRFSTGDYIATEGDEGTVVEVELLHTTLRTADAKIVSIPNGALINSHIVNYTQNNQRRVDMEFPISYEADVKLAKKIAYDTVAKHPLILPETAEPFVRVRSYGDSAVNLIARVWCKNEDYWTVYFDLLEDVREAFTQNGIQIPYNQLDVHIKSEQ